MSTIAMCRLLYIMFCPFHTQTRATYQCGDTFIFNGTPPDTCPPNHWWADQNQPRLHSSLRRQQHISVEIHLILMAYPLILVPIMGGPKQYQPGHDSKYQLGKTLWTTISVCICFLETLIREKCQTYFLILQQLIILCAILTTICIMLYYILQKCFQHSLWGR